MAKAHIAFGKVG